MNLYLLNLGSTNISLSGDNGLPKVFIPLIAAQNYVTLDIYKVIGNELLCDSISSLVSSSILQARMLNSTGKILTASEVLSFKAGNPFDLDSNGIVDDAENLNLVAKTEIDDSDSPYTVLATDSLIACDVSSAIIAITLPAGINGQVYEFKDSDGSAATNNVTITPDGTETIEGAATYVVSTDFGGIQMYFDSLTSDWKLLSASGASPAEIALNSAHRLGNGEDHATVLAYKEGMLPAYATADHTVAYVPLDADYVIGATSAGGAVAINLGALSGYTNNSAIIIKDEGGNAGVASITVTPDGAELIDGVNAAVIINVSYAVLRLYKRAGGWFTW